VTQIFLHLGQQTLWKNRLGQNHRTACRDSLFDVRGSNARPQDDDRHSLGRRVVVNAHAQIGRVTVSQDEIRDDHVGARLEALLNDLMTAGRQPNVKACPRKVVPVKLALIAKRLRDDDRRENSIQKAPAVTRDEIVETTVSTPGVIAQTKNGSDSPAMSVEGTQTDNSGKCEEQVAITILS
jgi:hypothetical protein